MRFLQRIKSDFTYVKGLSKLNKRLADVEPEADVLIPDDFEKTVDAHPDNLAVWFEGEETRYSELEARANKFANWALNAGFKSGDCIALFMENCPDYIAFWVGMTKIGVRCALINNQLTGKGLAHCIKIVDAHCVVMNSEQASLLDSAREHLPENTQVWTVGAPVEGALDLETVLTTTSDARPDRSLRADQRAKDIALYIYTSGTTGLPKAAKMTHVRVITMMRTFVPPCDVQPTDRIYITLPLYHGTGGICGVGCALETGAAIILRKKFSASAYWKEAKDTKATMFVYIGELGRYLMNQTPSPQEKDHAIIKGFGNGLRADVWAEFVDRTGIDWIVEFYGSTEGNVSFLNLDKKIGAIGRIPPLLKKAMPTKLIKIDLDSEEPIRDAQGFCVEAGPDEPGEAIGPIDPAAGRGRFDGYNDKEQTKKKILTDVFALDDMFFRTGDLLRRDRDGYFYFVDRIGDTFRWKSENVSTNEVGEVLSALNGVALANVYGVEVPGHEGRAGMAAITQSGELDLNALWRHVDQELPAYAQPLFLRVQPEAETTGTFKYRKVELVEHGFDPAKIDDPVYFNDSDNQTYSQLTPEMFAKICSGEHRV